METPFSIRQFWFGDSSDDRDTARQQAPLWWSKNDALDREVRQRFEATLVAAADGQLEAWTTTPDGVLALILLADQFSRNMYRGQARAFAFDALARRWSRLALEQQLDQVLRPIERVFVYLPLEHSEQLSDQEQALMLFERLLASVPAEQQDIYRGYLDYARQHRDVIARFGRFPHRNAILQRPSTAAELEFLAGPHSSF